MTTNRYLLVGSPSDGRSCILPRGGTIPTAAPAPDSIASPDGFAVAVRRITPALRTYARRLTREDGSIDDLVQDTLTRAWSARAQFEPGTNFKAWLFRIARNIFLSGVRRSMRMVRWDPDLHDRLLVATPLQEDGLHMRDLEAVLAALPAGQAEAFHLIVREGLSYEDAAHRLGQSAGTLKSRVARTRAHILASLSDRDESRPRRRTPSLRSTGYDRWKAAGTRIVG